jgi:hypothetical protein
VVLSLLGGAGLSNAGRQIASLKTIFYRQVGSRRLQRAHPLRVSMDGERSRGVPLCNGRMRALLSKKMVEGDNESMGQGRSREAAQKSARSEPLGHGGGRQTPKTAPEGERRKGGVTRPQETQTFKLLLLSGRGRSENDTTY